MGEETAAAREVHERPGAVTHGAAGGEGAERRGALRSAGLAKLTASFIWRNIDILSAGFLAAAGPSRLEFDAQFLLRRFVSGGGLFFIFYFTLESSSIPLL